jgi:hypothetical protein
MAWAPSVAKDFQRDRSVAPVIRAVISPTLSMIRFSERDKGPGSIKPRTQRKIQLSLALYCFLLLMNS